MDHVGRCGVLDCGSKLHFGNISTRIGRMSLPSAALTLTLGPCCVPPINMVTVSEWIRQSTRGVRLQVFTMFSSWLQAVRELRKVPPRLWKSSQKQLRDRYCKMPKHEMCIQSGRRVEIWTLPRSRCCNDLQRLWMHRSLALWASCSPCCTTGEVEAVVVLGERRTADPAHPRSATVALPHRTALTWTTASPRTWRCKRHQHGGACQQTGNDKSVRCGRQQDPWQAKLWTSKRSLGRCCRTCNGHLLKPQIQYLCLHGPDSTVNNRRYKESLLVNTAESHQRPMATKHPKLGPLTSTSRLQSSRFSLKPCCRSSKEHQTSSCTRGTTTSNTSCMG